MVRTLDADSSSAFERNRYRTSDQGRRDRQTTRSAGRPGNSAGARQTRSTSAGTRSAGQARNTSAGTGRNGQARSVSAGTRSAGQARTASAGTGKNGQARSTTSVATRSAGRARNASAGTGRNGQARSVSAGTRSAGQARTATAGTGRNGQVRSTSAGTRSAGQTRTASAGTGRNGQVRTASAETGRAGRAGQSPARTRRYEETAEARGVRVAEANREAGKTVRRSSPAAMSLQTVAGMLVIIAVMTVVLIYYIKLQADVTRTSQEIASLEQQLTQIKAENDASYNEINDSISLEEVRKRAIQDLGMKYADRDQVIIYSGTEKDSVHQVSSLNDR